MICRSHTRTPKSVHQRDAGQDVAVTSGAAQTHPRNPAPRFKGFACSFPAGSMRQAGTPRGISATFQVREQRATVPPPAALGFESQRCRKKRPWAAGRLDPAFARGVPVLKIGFQKKRSLAVCNEQRADSADRVGPTGRLEEKFK
jgi:hypothetical protein